MKLYRVTCWDGQPETDDRPAQLWWGTQAEAMRSARRRLGKPLLPGGPEWPEDYAAGVYSQPCEVCDGRTTVAVVNRKACTPEQLQALDDHEQAERYADAERAAERRMGC